MLREPASPVSEGKEGESDSGAERAEGMDARSELGWGHGRPRSVPKALYHNLTASGSPVYRHSARA